jgi:hypothetical protein
MPPQRLISLIVSLIFDIVLPQISISYLVNPLHNTLLFLLIIHTHLTHCLFQGKVSGKIVKRKESLWETELPSFGCLSEKKESVILVGPTHPDLRGKQETYM